MGCQSVSMRPVNLPKLLDHIEIRYIQRALKVCGMRRARACIMLGIPRTTLVEKMRKHGILMMLFQISDEYGNSLCTMRARSSMDALSKAKALGLSAATTAVVIRSPIAA